MAVLVAVPAALAFIPALIGRPMMNGDDTYQNYPLRVLVGQILRNGHLPWWDPLIWSGTPLLAGWNAGAASPTTWLFALLPDIWAWSLGQFVATVLGTLGMYVFLRRLELSPVAAFLGSATFVFTGFVGGQTAHYGLILGTNLLPFVLIAIDELWRRRSRPLGDLLWPALLLSGATALVVLAGEPRAITSDAIVAGIYLVACCWRSPRSAARLVAVVAAAGGLAVCLSLVQWLPGVEFLRASERGQATLSLYAQGSIDKSWLALFLAPFLLGGNGNLGLTGYVGPYNLPELSYGVGLLPLVACFGLAPTLWRRATRRGTELGVWYVLVLVGVVLALGINTPLGGRLLYHLPLFGSERLQNRNIAITDFALAVLLAVFVDAVAPSLSQAKRRVVPVLGRAGRLLGLVVPVATLVLLAAFVLDTRRVQTSMHLAAIHPHLPASLAGYLAVTALLAVAIGAFVLVAPHLAPRLRRRVVVTLSLVEVCFLALLGPYALAPAAALAPVNPASARLAHLTGPEGRYVLYDPDFYVWPGNPTPPVVTQLGFFDLNIVHSIESAQGYGSVVSADYEAATGSHEVGNFSLPAIDSSTSDALDVRVLLTSPLYLAHEIPLHGAVAVSTSNGPAFDIGPGERVEPGQLPAVAGARLVTPTGPQYWTFATPTAGAEVTVVTDAGSGQAGAPAPRRSLVISLLDAAGRSLTRTVPVVGTRATFDAPAGFAVQSVKVASSPSSGVVQIGNVVEIDPATETRYMLDGMLQGALHPPHWVYDGRLGSLLVFLNTAVRGPSYVTSAGAESTDDPPLPGSSARSPLVPVGDAETTAVSTPRPGLLVRSTAYAPDWYAEITPAGSTTSTTVAVRQLGAVQAVEVPAGRSVVVWVYRSRSIRASALVTALSALVFAALVVLAAVRSRRRRAGTGPAAPA